MEEIHCQEVWCVILILLLASIALHSIVHDKIFSYKFGRYNADFWERWLDLSTWLLYVAWVLAVLSFFRDWLSDEKEGVAEGNSDRD
jgi:hypothetical protein